MTEQNQNQPTETESTDEAEVVQQTRLQSFVNNHPRAARAIAITGAVVAAAGVGTVVNTARKNKHHLAAAAEHVHEAGSELSNAVSPTSETDA